MTEGLVFERGLVSFSPQNKETVFRAVSLLFSFDHAAAGLQNILQADL